MRKPHVRRVRTPPRKKIPRGVPGDFHRKLIALLFLIVALAVPASAQTADGRPLQDVRLTHRVQDEAAPLVLFTRDISGEGLVKIYRALGRKPEGKVGIKLTFESPNGPYLQPEMLRELCRLVQGTFIDSNGFTPPRDTTEGHLRVAKRHGFMDVGPVDILDAEGELDMPVRGGKHLKYHRTGSHFANYDSLISIVKFKPHHLRDYGGTIKNLTICLASISGKAILHSAGREERTYREGNLDDFLEAMADGTKAALDYKKDRWVFINVISAVAPDDGCKDAEPLPDIGIIASLDPVAVDQAAVDFTFGLAPSEEARARWEQLHHTRVLGYAEEIGAGKRNYRLLSID